MSQSVVIVGAGQAAAQMVASLRSEGFSGAITVIGDEPYLPYQRPPLSKAYLAGELAHERLYIRPAEFYAEAKCAMMLGTTALKVDRAAKTVETDKGVVPYDTLVFATGSRVRHLTSQGQDLPGVRYLRGIDDVQALQPYLKAGVKLVIIGAGYIGLEVAAVAKKRGLSVTVLEMAPRVMQRTAAPVISAFYEDEHRKAGVVIHTGARVDGIALKGVGFLIDTSAGPVEADVVIAGVGILPNVELAKEAGLNVANGIVVDEFARTSDPSVYAVGDCADLPCVHSPSERARLESVQNAIDQAKHAAMAICGKPKPYHEVPWFWSDQYDLKLQIAGLASPDDQLVLRGDPATRSFAVFRLRGAAIIGVEAVNAAPEYMMGRRLIAARAKVAPERLADRAIPMKEMGA
jgi:3-phenylpropionate/trans-cinnamate dioxygenase ferredoxin reductase subunit